MATTPEDQSVEDYIAGLENPERRSDATNVVRDHDRRDRRTAGDVGPDHDRIRPYHYRYASGHEGDAALASFAPRKQQLVVYLVGFDDRHAAQMKKLGPHKTGKGCLYLKRLADIDLDVLRTLIDRSVRVRRGVESQRTRRAPPPSRPHSPGQ